MVCMANQVSKQFLEEAEDNSLLDALDEYFGHEVVFNQDQSFDFQVSDLQSIFKLVNQCIFSSKLPPIEIKITEEDPEFKGGFIYQVSKKLDDNSIKIELFEKPIIVLYKIPDTNTFFQICDTLCHEMIHYYQRNQPEFDDMYFKMSNGIIDAIDLHDQKTFEDKMLEANELGLKVVKSQNPSESYLDMNFGARNKLYRVIGEDDDNDVIVAQNGGMTILRTRGSHKSCLQVLD